MFVVWVIFILLFVLSAVLLTGRGSFLIAGYNTSSPEEKEKYNAQKLCRTMGFLCYSYFSRLQDFFLFP